MKIQTLIKWLMPFGIVATLLSCDETFELDLRDDPNALTPEQADIDLFLNSIQFGLGEFIQSSTTDNFDGASQLGMEVTRMLHMFGPTYTNAYDPGSFNEVWEDAYADVLIDVRTMIPLAEEEELYTHIAIAQVVEAYVIMTLVDMFGDIPYSTALGGEEDFNPPVDDGASVYEAAESLLNSALENFAREESRLPSNDLFYNGNEDRWITLTNTLKLKLYLQTRLVDDNAGSKIQALVDEGDLIADQAGNFTFRWSQNDANPDSRHPLFAESFGTGSGPTLYMSNWYMNLLLNGQATPDPRIRYYFYRQVLNYDEANDNTKECTRETAPSHYAPDQVFCLIGTSGYWGRDHGDDDGIPPDDQFRTLLGVYPVGGPFDDNSAEPLFSSRDAGLAGAGISPIMMASFVDFMLAEAALTLGVSGDARNYLANGITKSINTVAEFGSTIADPEFIPAEEEIQAYVDDVLADYDAADEDGKLNIVVRQYFIALWGNGIEAYNAYRRTGKPADIQPALLASPGEYIRSFQYPARVADFNSNIEQKPATDPVPVFWDTNPDGFVD